MSSIPGQVCTNKSSESSFMKSTRPVTNQPFRLRPSAPRSLSDWMTTRVPLAATLASSSAGWTGTLIASTLVRPVVAVAVAVAAAAAVDRSANR
jgi:hypothetical protein